MPYDLLLSFYDERDIGVTSQCERFRREKELENNMRQKSSGKGAEKLGVGGI